MRKFLRHKDKGTIYNYNENMVEQGMAHLEVVTEEEAFPERFQPKKTRGRKPKVKLEKVVVEEENPDPTPPELAEEAAKGWPK
jgi:hypothetical protein